MLEINNPMQYKVAMYIRLSREDDENDEKYVSESIINQKSMLITFAKDNKLDVYDTYIDDGYSGTTFDRPDFSRMIKDIENKKVNMVITKDLSRLGRDYIQTGHYLEKFFPEKQVRYISILDEIDTGIENSSNDITPFKAILNDLYAKDISKKVKAVQVDKVRKGLYIGGKAPYGYKKDETNKNLLIIDEEASIIVKLIFELYLKGESLRGIAEILTNRGIKTPSEYKKMNYSYQALTFGMWNQNRIKAILTSEMYIGNMVQHKNKKINYKSKKRIELPKSEWITVENTHEAIIDNNIFYRVQKLIKATCNVWETKYNHEYLLNGLVYCNDCGKKMQLLVRHRNGHDGRNLRCSTYANRPARKVCESHYIKESLVTEIVLENLKEICNKYLDKSRLTKLADKIAVQSTIDIDKEILILSNKIISLNSNIDKIYVDKLNGLLPENDFIRISQTLFSQRGSLKEEIKDLEDSKKQEKILPKIDDIVEEFLKLQKPSKEVLFKLIDKVRITKEKNIIVDYEFTI
ncbi:MAG: recombinase family protein [Oscillospiraceae bacterium]|nr:recombinase family protein [Oscillospiraceae bacterium]